jgi:homoserine dehydrogenase
VLAERLGCAIKLLAHAKRLEGERFTAYVAPHLVPQTHLLASVQGVMNAVAVRGNAVGETLFYGAGAGRMPTASAMVADILDTMRRGNGRKFIDWGPEQPERFVDPDTVPTRWYVRWAEGGACAFAEGSVSVDGWRAAITPPMDRSALAAQLAGIEVGNIFRVLD